jgi:hypothetical protein
MEALTICTCPPSSLLIKNSTDVGFIQQLDAIGTKNREFLE